MMVNVFQLVLIGFPEDREDDWRVLCGTELGWDAIKSWYHARLASAQQLLGMLMFERRKCRLMKEEGSHSSSQRRQGWQTICTKFSECLESWWGSFRLGSF